MDLDNRWERVKLAYDLLVKGEGKAVDCIQKGIEASYEANVTDEFLKPIYKDGGDGKAIARIEDGDAVICFNFRTDRGREITRALTQEDFPEQDMKKLNFHYVTMTRYVDTFSNVTVIYEKKDCKMTWEKELEQR